MWSCGIIGEGEIRLDETLVTYPTASGGAPGYALPKDDEGFSTSPKRWGARCYSILISEPSSVGLVLEIWPLLPRMTSRTITFTLS